MPATGTGAEKADLTVVIGLRAHPLHCGLGIANHLGVGNAAVSAHFGGDVVQDLVAGQVDIAITDLITTLPQVRGGTIKAYAVAGKARLTKAHAWRTWA